MLTHFSYLYHFSYLCTFFQETHKDILESKKTIKGRKINKQPTWDLITSKFKGKTSTQVQDCWKNLRKRAIETKKEMDQQRDRTGGGVISKPIILSPLEEKILAIVKYAEPLQNINDSNAQKDASFQAVQNNESFCDNSKLSDKGFEPRSKQPKIADCVEISPTEKIAQKSQLKIEAELKWINHLNALKCYRECVQLSQGSYVPDTIVQLSHLHLASIVETGRAIYGPNSLSDSTSQPMMSPPMMPNNDKENHLW